MLVEILIKKRIKIRCGIGGDDDPSSPLIGKGLVESSLINETYAM